MHTVHLFSLKIFVLGDSTRDPNATGSEVVEMTISLIQVRLFVKYRYDFLYSQLFNKTLTILKKFFTRMCHFRNKLIWTISIIYFQKNVTIHYVSLVECLV